MPSFRMPFWAVPCSIWLPVKSGTDAFGNETINYAEEPDVITKCCYAPGSSRPETEDEFEDARPRGARVTMTFFLPKSVVADLRDARISCTPPDDPALASMVFDVVGEPYSYPRTNTPGDYSWCVEAVAYLG